MPIVIGPLVFEVYAPLRYCRHVFIISYLYRCILLIKFEDCADLGHEFKEKCPTLCQAFFLRLLVIASGENRTTRAFSFLYSFESLEIRSKADWSEAEGARVVSDIETRSQATKFEIDS